MMKKFFFACMAAFLMGSVATAQEERPERKPFDAEAQAKRMTERMVKEYALTDAQMEKLLVVNREWMEKMKDMPTPPRQHPGKRQGEKSCCCCCKAGAPGPGPEMERPEQQAPLTDEQRAEQKKEREKKMEEMKAARQAYEDQLKQIMTEEQFANYQKKQHRGRP